MTRCHRRHQQSFTIGISVFPRDGSDAETLVRNASAAKWSAKEHSHNTYAFFKPQLYEQTIERGAGRSEE
jgi:GGDEF domain-containing protein